MRYVSLAVFAVCCVGLAWGQSDPAQDGSEALTQVTLEGLLRPDGDASSLQVTLPQGTHRDWPVVLFIHGHSAKPEYYTTLVENLASRGFAVANFDQIYRFESDLRKWEQGGRTAIDALEAAAGDPNSPLFGLLDMSKLAVMGHSYGGATTTCLAAVDPRVKVGVALTPGVQAFSRGHYLKRAGEVRVPFMVVGAEFDPVVPAALFARPGFRALTASSRLYVEIARAEHLTIADSDIGYIQWTPLRFPFWAFTRRPSEVREVSRRYATGWIEHHLGIRADTLGIVDGSLAARDTATRSLSRYGTPTRRP